MKILILHRVPYARIDYERGLDHERHDVTYFGKREILATLPQQLRCTAVERRGVGTAFEEAKAWLEREPQQFDRVISISEYELLDAAALREWLGVPGATVEQVSLVRNKMAMKNAVALTGIRVPRFLSLGDLLAAQGRAPWSGRTVLKPHSGASSTDVVVFEQPSGVWEALNQRRTGVAKLDREAPVLGDYQVEEFVAGPIVHFDGLVKNGRVAVMTASRYVGTCLGYANGRPLGSYHIPLTETWRPWIDEVLEAVRIRNGSFHLEAIESGNELVFLEVGNRVGGADVVATFELATGVHMPSEELGLLIGAASSGPRLAAPDRKRWHGWFVYPGHHAGSGTFAGFDGIDAFRNSPSVVTWTELAAGTNLRRDITYSAHEAPLAGIVATGSPQTTREWIEALVAAAAIRVQDADVADMKHVA